MARGFKTGGRRKGSKNKRTLQLEGAARQLLDNAGEILGKNVFEGDAHALLILIYKNTALPLELRMDAAKAAIRFEKPAKAVIDANTTIDNVVYVVTDEPLTHEQWAEQYCADPKTAH